MRIMNIVPGELTLEQLGVFLAEPTEIAFDFNKTCIAQSKAVVDAICADPKKIVYGINTGFGKLHDKVIDHDRLHELQTKLILSHATGVGEPLPDSIVRTILLLKINALAQGFSGVRYDLIDVLNRFLQNNVCPVVPSLGSVGASGDLAPLSHLVLPLLGLGEVSIDAKRYSGAQALNALNLEKQVLEAKEGLALINGTQVSLALLSDAYFKTVRIVDTCMVAVALTMMATKARTQFLDHRIHQVRRLSGQIEVARCLRKLLENCHWEPPKNKVQDPYSIRCVPQVIGACLDQINGVGEILSNEINAVTDNPLVFADTNEIVSGGNFHAEPLALAADALANVLCELGNISERRIAMMMDPGFSGLPAFLVANSGINSGFMNMHVTASALANANKAQTMPRSTDTIPTSMNQEDHVSMATNAALRLQEICANTQNILAIELVSALQGCRFNKELKTNDKIKEIYESLCERIPFFEEDSYFSPYIEQMAYTTNEEFFILSENYRCTIKGREPNF